MGHGVPGSAWNPVTHLALKLPAGWSHRSSFRGGSAEAGHKERSPSGMYTHRAGEVAPHVPALPVSREDHGSWGSRN